MFKEIVVDYSIRVADCSIRVSRSIHCPVKVGGGSMAPPVSTTYAIYYTIYFTVHYTIHHTIHYAINYTIHYTIHHIMHYTIHCTMHYTICYTVHYTIHYRSRIVTGLNPAPYD